MTNLVPNKGLEKELSKMNKYVSSWPGSRRRTLTPKRGDMEEELGEHCAGVDLKTCTNDHRDHY